MKKVFLAAAVILAMATGAMAENKNVTAGYFGGIQDGRLALGTGVMFHNFGGDFWGGSNKYGTDLKVSIPCNEKLSVIGSVGIEVRNGDLKPAGGGELTYKFPLTDGQGFIAGAGYHSALGVTSSFGYYFK